MIDSISMDFWPMEYDEIGAVLEKYKRARAAGAPRAPSSAGQPAVVIGTRRLMLTTNGTMGFVKDTTGKVRGLWFADKNHASKVSMLKAAIAMFQVTEGWGTIESSDYSACMAGSCTVAQAEGGYLVVFPSAKTAPDFAGRK